MVYKVEFDILKCCFYISSKDEFVHFILVSAQWIVFDKLRISRISYVNNWIIYD